MYVIITKFIMIIQKITTANPAIISSINKLLVQLTSNAKALDIESFTKIISDSNSHLFISSNEQGEYTGMVTVGYYSAPTGKKAWIEDVVVDEAFRAGGIGKALVEHAIEFCKTEGASTLMLTSRASRINANKLYQRLGFERRETNVYKMNL